MKQLTDKLFKIFLVATIFLLPWQTRWIFFDQLINNQIWEYGRLSLYASMTTLLLAAVFWYLANSKTLVFNLKNRTSLTIIILSVYLLIVGLLSPLPIVSLYYSALILLAFLFVYLLNKIKIRFILFVLLISGLLQGGLANWQLWQQQVVANKWLGLAQHLPEVAGTAVVQLTDGRLLRAYGALTHPNVLGGFLVLTIVAGLWYWIYIYQQVAKNNWQSARKFIWPLVLTLVSLVIMTYGLLVSFSRSALLSLIIIIFVSLLIVIIKKEKLKIVVFIKYVFIFLLVSSAFYLLMPGVWDSRLQANNHLETQSINQRIVSLQQIDFSNAKELILGQGLGLNSYVYQPEGQAPYTVQPIHNYFLLALAEVGLLGLILLFYLFYTYYRQTKWQLSQALFLLWAIVGLFDHYFWTSWTGWLILAIILALSPPQKRLK